MNLAFSGPDRRLPTATDILLLESGKMGEQALVFLTDGADQEYRADHGGDREDSTGRTSHQIGIDLAGRPVPVRASWHPPRRHWIWAAQSPGFDLSNVQARVSHDCGAKACCPNPSAGPRMSSPDVRADLDPGMCRRRQRIYLSTVESQVRSAAAEALLAASRPRQTASSRHARVGQDVLLASGRRPPARCQPRPTPATCGRSLWRITW